MSVVSCAIVCIAACGSIASTNAADANSTAAANGNTTTSGDVDVGVTTADGTVLYVDPNSAIVGTVVNGNIVLSPTVEVGPYWVEENLNRSDVTTDPNTGVAQSGVLLRVDITLSDVANNAASLLAGAQIDLWQANATGIYSDESAENTVGNRYLRGYQLSDVNGKVSFDTIVPGWYSGRAPHIHLRVRNAAKTYNWTTQIFFDDAFTAAIYKANAPYNTRTNQDTFASNDRLYQSSCVEGTKTYHCGELTQATILQNSSGKYIATTHIFVDTTGT